MYEVLVPIDESMDRVNAQINALRELREEGTDVEAYLIHVFDENQPGASVQQVDSVRHAQTELQDEDIGVTLLEASGDPIKRILDHAQEYDVNVICLGGRKRTPAGKVLFGSTTQSVALESNRPVFICGIEEENR